MRLTLGRSYLVENGDVTWTDLKGGNNGTLNNMDASNFSTDNGGTLTFDGTNEAVRFSTYTQPQYTTTTDFTWCIWFMSLAASSNNIVMGNRYYGTGCGTGSPYAFVKLTTRKFEFVNSQNTFHYSLDFNKCLAICNHYKKRIYYKLLQ